MTALAAQAAPRSGVRRQRRARRRLSARRLRDGDAGAGHEWPRSNTRWRRRASSSSMRTPRSAASGPAGAGWRAARRPSSSLRDADGTCSRTDPAERVRVQLGLESMNLADRTAALIATVEQYRARALRRELLEPARAEARTIVEAALADARAPRHDRDRRGAQAHARDVSAVEAGLATDRRLVASSARCGNSGWPGGACAQRWPRAGPTGGAPRWVAAHWRGRVECLRASRVAHPPSRGMERRRTRHCAEQLRTRGHPGGVRRRPGARRRVRRHCGHNILDAPSTACSPTAGIEGGCCSALEDGPRMTGSRARIAGSAARCCARAPRTFPAARGDPRRAAACWGK